MRFHGLRCDACRGVGCERCAWTGEWHLESCPRRFVDGATWAALMAADLARKGSWPEPGGWLDQLRVVVDAVSAVWADEAPLRAKARMFDW